MPNQNSFGHLAIGSLIRRLKNSAETSEPWPDQGGAFLRHPATLAPNNPGTLPFLRGLYDELLPHFTSNRFNVGCDETWDLGPRPEQRTMRRNWQRPRLSRFPKKNSSRNLARAKSRCCSGATSFCIIPELVKELPKDVVALNWGYEANHPFDKEAGNFRQIKNPILRLSRHFDLDDFAWPARQRIRQSARSRAMAANTARSVISTPIGATAVIRNRWRSVIFLICSARR